MLPQEVIVILDVLRHILVDSEAYREALGTKLLEKLRDSLDNRASCPTHLATTVDLQPSEHL